MKKTLIGLLVLAAVGAAVIFAWPHLTSTLIKEDAAKAEVTGEALRLLNERLKLLERIQQLKPGGSLATRLVDLEARKDQLVRNYPEGHPDIDLLNKQIATTRGALEKLPSLELEYSTLTQKLEEARSHMNTSPSKKGMTISPWISAAVQMPGLWFVSEATLKFTGEAADLPKGLMGLGSVEMLRASRVAVIPVEGQPTHVRLQAEDRAPSRVSKKIHEAITAISTSSEKLRRAELQKTIGSLKEQKLRIDTRFAKLAEDRKALVAAPLRNTPNAQVLAKVETLKVRRRTLIENYPTHSDIPLLAIQIKTLLAQTGQRPPNIANKAVIYDRQMNESKVWMDYLGRRIQTLTLEEKSVSSAWAVEKPATQPVWPQRVTGWPIGIVALILIGVAVRKIGKRGKKNSHADRRSADHLLTALSAKGPASTPAETPKPEPAPVALEVVSPELPDDPLTIKAASLYARWMEVTKILYSPSLQPPEGILESVTPLLAESCEFLPQGHDVLARYLARSVEPGNLPAHVARTVLMALTAAEEAGMSPDHRLATALAALFHDLAVVPRPGPQQDEVGSEVGRLSAVLLRRIPGLEPAMLAMVEDILIGMDEFKLETWQNVTQGKVLEPLSKVLREIDRFEKVMQKQKSRLQRQLKAAQSA